MIDPRDIAARDDAIALERLARETLERRDAIVRRLRRNTTLQPLGQAEHLAEPPLDIIKLDG